MSVVNINIFEPLFNKTIVKIEGAEEESEEIFFIMSNGDVLRMYHEVTLWEDVRIEDIGGDINNIIGVPIKESIVIIEEGDLDYGCTYTRTWFQFLTDKGYVAIRWKSLSDGCCSESVDYDLIKKGESS